jgi:adenylosuccinate synthase
MRRATAVIGANYGDEAKGRMVDYLASGVSADCAVVRFNGGAQAGHTVVTPDDRRRVFHHLGSGTLAGAKTYLAKHFVLNPILFWHEYAEFLEVRLAPPVAADPRCYVTTPYDMLINQMVEDHRGAARHGSCGVGFGETIERNNYPAFRLLKDDLSASDKLLKQKLINIRDNWMPARLHQLGVPPLVGDDTHLGNNWVDAFIAAARKFDHAVPSAGLEYIQSSQIIFEGAQGLLLDQEYGEFPHVTRSNTGLKNVVPIARALALELDVVYVSRTYLTRHGAGAIKNEFVPNPVPIDATNQSHPYQGTLRFGHLDPRGLKERVSHDLAIGGCSVSSVHLALTCCDQVTIAMPDVGLAIGYRGFGPRRDQTETVI